MTLSPLLLHCPRPLLSLFLPDKFAVASHKLMESGGQGSYFFKVIIPLSKCFQLGLSRMSALTTGDLPCCQPAVTLGEHVQSGIHPFTRRLLSRERWK